MAFLTTLARVYRLGREMHPDLSLNHLKHQINLMVTALMHFSDIQKWYETSENPLLAKTLKHVPLVSGAIYWPYLNYTWSMKLKLSTIDQHYRMLDGAATIIAHATFKETELARLDEKYPELRIVLDKPSWFLREGEIVLNLFIGDQRFYSIAFTLGLDSGQPIVFVGALQGSNSDTALSVYRDITHALHGLRPRDLLMVLLKMLCQELQINRILAVSGDKRQHNSPYFGMSQRDKVLVPYDQVWLEHGGVALDNGFYSIPAVFRHKDSEDIATRKRAAYRKRYQFLDKLALDIKSICAQHASQLEPNPTITKQNI